MSENSINNPAPVSLDDIFSISGMIFLVLDKKGNINFINDKGCEILQSNKNSVLGKNWFDNFVPFFVKDNLRSVFNDMINSNAEFSEYNENPVITSNGEERLISWHNKLIRDNNGNVTGILSSGEDISEKYIIKKKLLLLSNSIEASVDGIGIVDKSGNYTFMNKAHAEIYGYDSPSELIGKKWQILYTENELKKFKDEIMPEFAENGFWRGMATGKKKDGSTFPQEISLTAVDGGGLVCVVWDISKTVKSEQELKDSESRYRSLFHNNYSVMLIIDPGTGDIVDANSAACKFYGWKHSELTKMKIQKINTLSDLEVKHEMQKAKNENRNHFYFKHRLSSGEIRDVEVYSGPIKLSGKDYLYSIVHDITDRIHAEEALRLNEEKMRLLVEGTQSLFFYTQDINANITYISPSVEDITGRKIEEWIGQKHWFVTDAEINNFAKSRTHAHLKGETTKGPIIVEVRHADEHSILLEVFESPIVQNGEVTGIHGVAQDITKRKRAEEQIQKDLEIRETLLKEIHHRVKNNLNVITSLLNLQAERIKTKEDAIAAFQKSRDRIYSMALVHEKLYSSKDFSHIDMKPYIESLSNELLRIYLSSVHVRINLKVENVFLDIDKAIPCGLIINELITNSMKHSFPDMSNGEIDILLHPIKKNMIELIVRDNGTGLPLDFDIEKQESLGLRLIKILTIQIDGTLQVFNDKGAVFKIKFPETNYIRMGR
ncbi:PAS domain S-box protein [bacterium]|nr:PAS domain S-box protein [bacterium]